MNPRKELGVDNEYLYFIDVSILKRFSKTRKYKISGIESIRTNGIHSKTTEIIDLFAPANHGGFANNIEITFKNSSSESFQIPIYKKDLNAIIKIVKDKMVSC